MMSPEQRFIQLTKNLEIKTDKEKFPESIFFFKEKYWILEIKNSTLFCSYDRFWLFFMWNLI